MAKPPNPNSLLILTFSLLFSLSTSSFTPIDHYLINCGSPLPSITDSNNRKFFSDEHESANSVLLSTTRTIPLSFDSGSDPSGVYSSVRLFTRPSSYVIKVRDKGPHFVRLHFHRFNSEKFGIEDAQFHVFANGFLLLNDFNGVGMGKDVEMKEYILWVDSDELEISFNPSKTSKFGFVNAIEVISAPKDLILDIAQMVDSNGVVKIDGVTKNGFQTMYRVNVGGPKVTPFNDSIWRTWVPDDEFVRSSGESKEVHFSGRIKFREGGASREVAPDNVYDSARVIGGGGGSGSAVSKFNLTWGFPVVDGYKYLVRTHFCDVASPVLGSLYFNVYVNGNLAYENLDLSTITNSLASPFYADFVVDGGNTGVVTVSVRPLSGSSSSGVDALLNGIEVFKLNNSMNSFDGLVSASSILRRCHGTNGGVLVPLAAAFGLLVAASVVLRKNFMAMRDSLTWSRLPMDVSEVDLKSRYR